MNVAKMINTELDKRGKSAKWLHDQLFITIPVSIGDYEAFEFRLKENKLTALDLVYISAILDLDLNELTGRVRDTWRMKAQEDMVRQKRILNNSSYQGDGLVRSFHRDNSIIYLLTTNSSKGLIALEEYKMGVTNTLVLHQGVDASITKEMTRELLFELLMEGLRTKQIQEFVKWGSPQSEC
jgi:hypothetical protein